MAVERGIEQDRSADRQRPYTTLVLLLAPNVGKQLFLPNAAITGSGGSRGRRGQRRHDETSFPELHVPLTHPLGDVGIVVIRRSQDVPPCSSLHPSCIVFGLLGLSIVQEAEKNRPKDCVFGVVEQSQV